MTSVADLRAMPGVMVGHVLLIDGISTGWTDNDALLDLNTGYGHTIVPGLSREGLQWRMGIDVRTGQLLESPATFTINDFSATHPDAINLAELFTATAPDETRLNDVPFGAGLPIAPSDDLSARTDLRDMHVGLEAVGHDGQRHRFSVPPGFTIGLEHAIATSESDLAAAPVSSVPIVWNGRRCALYRIYYDRPVGAWHSWSNAVRLWWGTLRDSGTVSGRTWTLEADGPESLLRKPLALGMQAEPVPAVGVVELEPNQVGIGIKLWHYVYTAGAGQWHAYGVRDFDAAFTGNTAKTLLEELQAELAVAKATAGVDGTWDDRSGLHANVSENGFDVGCLNSKDEQVEVTICLHRKVWAILGYDVEVQSTLDGEDPQYVPFQPMGLSGEFAEVSGDDYWFAVLENKPFLDSKLYKPAYVGGTHALLSNLNGGAGQLVYLGSSATLGGDTTSTTVRHSGQLLSPVASSTGDPTAAIEIDGTPCDTTGFFLFVGKKRFAGQEDAFDEAWVGEASWINGVVAESGLVSGDRIIVTRWHDPELFGFRIQAGYAGPKSDWIAQIAPEEDEVAIRAVPIAVLGYSTGLDEPHIVLQRLLKSTGTTTGWDSFAADPDAALVSGDNSHHDREIASLGLAIPDDWVESPTDFAAVADRTEAEGQRCKLVISPAYQAADAVRSLTQPLGWCLHLRDGRYGIFAPSDPLTLSDATVVLDRSVRSSTYTESVSMLSQDLRKWQPIDKWTIDWGWTPFFNKTMATVTRATPDPQFRYRPGEVEHRVMGHGMRTKTDITSRIQQVSNWAAKRHFEVRSYPLPLLQDDVWPGTIVRITDPQLVDPSGSYGVTNRIAIVTAVNTRLGVDTGTKTCDLLVLGDRTSTPRVHAPSARGIGYSSSSGRLYVQGNWLDYEATSWRDADYFVEPTYTGITAFGGNAIVSWYQWDGESWSITGRGTVAGTGTEVGIGVDGTDVDYLTLTGVTGTYYRDMDTIVVLTPTDVVENAAWVDAIYSPICDDAGEWEDRAAPGTPVPGYGWEG